MSYPIYKSTQSTCSIYFNSPFISPFVIFEAISSILIDKAYSKLIFYTCHLNYTRLLPNQLLPPDININFICPYLPIIMRLLYPPM